LLVDFRNSIASAMKKGTGLKEFKESFDQIVKKHGWVHKGSPGWRARVIFQTNMTTSYQAGRYKQMTDPDVLATRPYWEYKHGGSKNPRIRHLRLDGLVLPADDPFWRSHYPPNGWGCSCRVVARSERDLKRLGKRVDQSPEIDYVDQVVGKGSEARTLKVPKDIDPGWDYNPGQAAYGDMSRSVPLVSGVKNWSAVGVREDWKSLGLDKSLPLARVKPTYKIQAKGVADAAKSLKKLYGEEPVFSFKANGHEYKIAMDARFLARHLVEDNKDLQRLDFIEFLGNAIEKPAEVWARFEQNDTSGKVRMVLNFFKGYDSGSTGKKNLIVVANAVNGKLSVTTMYPTFNEKYVNSKRTGKLLLKS
jgi:hypothetical protein